MSNEDNLRNQRDRLSSPTPREQSPASRVFSRGGRRPGSQFLIGGTIVVIGLALLLDNLGVVSSDQVLRFWPVLFIFVGLRDLIVTQERSRAMRGTLFVAFGVLLLLNTLDVFNFNFVALWPLFLILFGAHMLIRSMAPREAVISGELDDSGEFDDFAFLGGVKRSVTSQSFRGGSASSFMGGVDIDLRRAKMQADRVVINVFAMMGGIVLRVPEDWAVVSNVTALLGGVDDKTRPPAEPSGTLVLEGSAIMGGVEIKD